MSYYKNQKYIVSINYDFNPNMSSLTMLYTPIIGANALTLYTFFVNEAKLQSELRGISSNHSRIFVQLQTGHKEFNEVKKKLEAIGLLETYMEETNNEVKYIYVLKEPLNWMEFTANAKLKHLLSESIGEKEFDRLTYTFMNKRIPKTALNITMPFDKFFNDESVSKIKVFDFDRLYNDLIKHTKSIVAIKDDVKALIETYSKTHQLTFNEILNCCFQSIEQNRSGYMVNVFLLNDKLKLLIDTSSVIGIKETIKINRNAMIFFSNAKISNLQYIISDYKNINSEQYLSLIQKISLSEEDRKVIAQLKKSYKLPDCLINVLVDYCIMKNKGRLEINYLKRIALSINRLGIDSVESIINYLRAANNKRSLKLGDEAIKMIANPKQISSKTKVNNASNAIDWD